MTLNEPLISELQVEAATTRKILQRVPEESFNWKPHEKSRTLGEISGHIANLPGLFIAALAKNELDRFTYKSNVDNVNNILDTFDKNVFNSLDILKIISDEMMLSKWTYRYGEKVIFELPRFVVIRTTALNHLIHHRGQLSVYLRLLNISLPPVYGPTADEQ
jgi:uncharacterized damage-inducible protein DinB